MPALSSNTVADMLAALHMSPEELAEETQLSLVTVQRVIEGRQANARTRARILATINTRRRAVGLPALLAVEVFPQG